MKAPTPREFREIVDHAMAHHPGHHIDGPNGVVPKRQFREDIAPVIAAYATLWAERESALKHSRCVEQHSIARADAAETERDSLRIHCARMDAELDRLRESGAELAVAYDDLRARVVSLAVRLQPQEKETK